LSIGFVHGEIQIPGGYIDVPGDGLCFYHAVARQLGADLYTGQELQQMAIDEVLNHPNHYGAFAVGDLNGLLNYHLQRQENTKGGWADNIMMQALANAIGYVVEVQLFDLQGNALGAAPVRIEPQNDIAEARVLRLGNIENLHFVARAIAHAPNEEHEVVGNGTLIGSGFGSDVEDHMLTSTSPEPDGDNATLQGYPLMEVYADAILSPAGEIASFMEE